MRAPRKASLLGLLLAATLSAGACAEEASPGDATLTQGATAAALTCMPFSMRQCPCPRGGIGVQQCVPQGNAYGACVECPEPAAPVTTMATMAPLLQPGAAAGMGATPPMPDASVPGETDATVGAEVDGATADGSADTGGGADAAVQGSGLSIQGSVPGTSCGVGLPALCALETEKCCVRSLETDTCIGAAESCDCGLTQCDVMEAHCDGPEDCADGEVCCGTLGGSTYTRFECAASCDYAGSQRIACHQDAPTCPGNNVCANSQLLTNLQVCIDPATIRQ